MFVIFHKSPQIYRIRLHIYLYFIRQIIPRERHTRDSSCIKHLRVKHLTLTKGASIKPHCNILNNIQRNFQIVKHSLLTLGRKLSNIVPCYSHTARVYNTYKSGLYLNGNDLLSNK